MGAGGKKKLTDPTHKCAWEDLKSGFSNDRLVEFISRARVFDPVKLDVVKKR